MKKKEKKEREKLIAEIDESFERTINNLSTTMLYIENTRAFLTNFKKLFTPKGDEK